MFKTILYIWVMTAILMMLIFLGLSIETKEPEIEILSDIPHIEESVFRTMKVTAYCPCSKCCGYGSPGITASGVRAIGFMVAAPRSIPFKTKLIIPGYNNNEIVLVEDRGGSIKGNRLDVLFPTHNDALLWGVRELEIEFVGE